MSIPLSGKEMYDDLVNHRFGLNVASITEVEIGDYDLSTGDIFNKYSIEYDEPVVFNDVEDDSRHVGYGESQGVKGWATNYTHNNELKTAIFIVANPEYSGPQLEEEDQSEFVSILKTITLLHELGHVHDIQNSINFDHSSQNVNLIAAEAYADVFALRKLKSWKHPYGKLALKTFSVALLDRRNTSEFYEQVHSNIKKKVLESKLRTWSK
ncbi:hypothetical protein BA893_16080 [Vibrio natriegens]|uniref:hypothetical protein n=1 Tax=Vibrio natriegens TaxID=691 RepID=UPI000803D2F2|nr:hypothetical protein [Vibrio natriegens]ANQ23190.1 hypothetical protein BA893_16080 [Vibrio natriegens]